ncbi:hypothetical protein M9H77_35884 [Catharanthus roseus]|uniref:Uncharacterized protein n=1 Tax=Catharanthus roseus TaxID=4058 RepID=A0ACB9ZQA0_CATRO|nr:hypothetical protein M9H77_35884 [Catharanthus roseus]
MCHLATKIENQRKRVDFSKTTLPSSRNVVPKPQAFAYKSWPKKEDTPKVAFNDHSKPKVEEKGKLITNPTSYQLPTKRTLVFSEDLNVWIEKSDDDYQEGIVDRDESSEDQDITSLKPVKRE